MVGKWSVRNPLTFQERMVIKNGIENDLSYSEIAYSIKRANTTIKKEARRLGDVMDYDPVKAQEHFERKQFEGWKKISETQKRKYERRVR